MKTIWSFNIACIVLGLIVLPTSSGYAARKAVQCPSGQVMTGIDKGIICTPISELVECPCFTQQQMDDLLDQHASFNECQFGDRGNNSYSIKGDDISGSPVVNRMAAQVSETSSGTLVCGLCIDSPATESPCGADGDYLSFPASHLSFHEYEACGNIIARAAANHGINCSCVVDCI